MFTLWPGLLENVHNDKGIKVKAISLDNINYEEKND